MAKNLDDLPAMLCSYGARVDDVVLLDDSSPPACKIRYLDLLRGRTEESPWPAAVIEAAGQPVLYVVDASTVRPQGLPLARLCRILAFRGGADHMALIEPGRITVYPVSLSDGSPQPWRTLESDDPAAAGLIPTIAAPTESGTSTAVQQASASTAVHDLLIELLTETTKALTAHGIQHLDALSLVGRALFVRFMADRKIITDRDFAEIGPVAACFDSAASAAKVSRWLDDTFNGDFLPLPHAGTRAWFRGLAPSVFTELGKILRRAEPGGQLHLGWDDLLFDHIPVGLLSQVYEHHAHHFDPEGAERTSVLYTPRHIAAYMIDEVFFALGSSAASARILDPSAGGGVFLVEAFRQLVAARWQADGVPPNTTALRRILYEQICGFDISEPALRLCSLGLYLTALELDPGPHPLSRLRFDQPLLGTVLHDVRAAKNRHRYLGSLGAAVGDEHRHRYDVVIGNPPWNTWKATQAVSASDVEAQVLQVEANIRPIVRARLGEAAEQRYTMLDKVPDLPFVWRAMEWAKPGGRIAFVLHGRLLFKQSERGQHSRNDLMHALTVTGILNGTAVRQSQYWPNVAAPFCLLFAQNTPAGEDASFWFVSPALEDNLHRKARWRIDEASAHCVELSELEARPALLKTLFRGTELDMQILERLDGLKLRSLVEYWDDHKKYQGQGFKVGGVEATSRPQHPARDLWGLRALRERPSAQDLDTLDLPPIPRGFKCQHQRERTIYEAPLLLIAETPPRNSDAVHVYLGLRKDVAYNQSFRGFSCAWHPRAELLARYLFLIFGSCLPVYRALLTSGKFGVERDIYEADDLRNFPLRRLEDLQEPMISQIVPLSDALLKRPGATRAAVDAWVCQVYQLGTRDLQVIRDTLSVASPFTGAKEYAQRRPTSAALDEYLGVLSAIIEAFIGRFDRVATVRVARNSPGEPWIVLQLDTRPKGQPIPSLIANEKALLDVLQDADTLGASRATVVSASSRLLIANVAQMRYFTVSRARLLGLELVHEQADVLLGGMDG